MLHGSMIDPTFGVNGEAEVAGDLFVVQPDGKIISIEKLPDGAGITIRRYLASGLADLTFGLDGAESINPTSCAEYPKALAVEPGGKVVVAINTYGCDVGDAASLLVRFNVNGKLDQSFGAVGIAVLNDPVLGSINALAIQPDGKIVFAGQGKWFTYYTMLLGRCTSAGTLDRTFGRGGVVLTWYEGCGACPPEGSLDSVSITPDGSILAGGLMAFSYLDRIDLAITKFNNLGRLEFLRHYRSGYSDHYGTLRFVKQLPDGKILGIGESIARFLSDGTLDPAFRLNGLFYAGGAIAGHGAILPDGNILHANRIGNPGGPDANSISLVSRDGRALGGIYTRLAPFPLKAALAQPDGKIIVITDKMRRYTSIGSAAAESGLIGYFRPADGRWSIRYDYSQNEYAFGLAGDIPTPGHYPPAIPGSMGTTSLVGVYRPSNGNWYIATTTGYAIPLTGSVDERPVVGDYDGDGFDDFTLFENGRWRMVLSSDWSKPVRSWGTAGDLTVRGDYDRDGIDDLAVFRPSTGVWYILRSTDGSMQAEQFGLGTDRPVPGDYDGDGRTDLAVFRPSNGVWYIRNSFDGSVRAVQFGISSDRPVPADYDSDQLTDVAIFRDGSWYIAQSGNNTLKVVQWGQAGDVPLSPGFTAN
ncbi:MAG: FG-GAP-like repeat-containing protein [Pyrinomonadaceae bacterium]